MNPDACSLYQCPVCLRDEYTDEAYTGYICNCCGAEIGYDYDYDFDSGLIESYRAKWVGDGCVWFYGTPPPGYDPKEVARVLSTHGVVLKS